MARSVCSIMVMSRSSLVSSLVAITVTSKLDYAEKPLKAACGKLFVRMYDKKIVPLRPRLGIQIFNFEGRLVSTSNQMGFVDDSLIFALGGCGRVIALHSNATLFSIAPRAKLFVTRIFRLCCTLKVQLLEIDSRY